MNWTQHPLFTGQEYIWLVRILKPMYSYLSVKPSKFLKFKICPSIYPHSTVKPSQEGCDKCSQKNGWKDSTHQIRGTAACIWWAPGFDTSINATITLYVTYKSTFASFIRLETLKGDLVHKKYSINIRWQNPLMHLCTCLGDSVDLKDCLVH